RSFAGQFKAHAAKQEEAAEAVCPADGAMSCARRVRNRVRGRGGYGCGELSVLWRGRDGDTCGFLAVDPGPIVVCAIDEDVGDASGHHAFVVPQRATGRLGAGAVEDRDFVL